MGATIQPVMLNVRVGWSQIKGCRNSQQDRATIVTWPSGFRLLIVADGMGGQRGGDVASHVVLEKFKQHFVESQERNIRRRLVAALEAANVALYHEVVKTPELVGMGTTLLAVTFDGSAIRWVSVGDSPLWLIRNGEIQRLNQNHSVAQILEDKVKAGIISEQTAKYAPDRSELLEAVMGENIKMLDAPEQSMTLEEGDIVVLASDGVESCSAQSIASLVKPGQGVEQFVSAVLDSVLSERRVSQDNATLAVLQVEECDEGAVRAREDSGHLCGVEAPSSPSN